MSATEHPAATQARAAYGDDYGDYIQSATAEHVAKGHYSHEYAMGATLGDMLAGNDGA